MYIQGIKMELPKPKLVKNFMNVTLKSWDDLPGKVGEQNFNEIINKDIKERIISLADDAIYLNKKLI